MRPRCNSRLESDEGCSDVFSLFFPPPMRRSFLRARREREEERRDHDVTFVTSVTKGERATLQPPPAGAINHFATAKITVCIPLGDIFSLSINATFNHASLFLDFSLAFNELHH